MTPPKPKKPATTRVGLYLRMSLDATGEGLGVDRQRQDCVELAAQLGWEVVETYIDNDISATKGKKRPGYERMLADIEASRLDAIIAWSPDRIYRRLKDLEHLIEVLERHSVQVRTVKAGELNLNTAYGRMLARILGSVAAGEGEIKSERWLRSWRQAREQGKPVTAGVRLFGYTRDMDVIPGEAAVAKRMAADLISGVNPEQIAAGLEADGVRTTRGGLWRPTGVRVYLANPKLAGWSTLKGEVVGRGVWEPVLEPDTWETVKALLEAQPGRQAAVRVAVLGGLILCGNCGHRLITSRGTSRGGSARRTYRCPNRPGMRGCGKVTAVAEPIEELIEDYAQERLLTHGARRRADQLVGVQGAGAALAEVQALEARLLELEAELEQPDVPVTVVTRAISRTQERLGELRRQVSHDAELAAAENDALRVGDEWPEDLAHRRRLVMLALEDLRVYLLPSIPGAPGNRFDARRIEIYNPAEVVFPIAHSCHVSTPNG